MGGNCPGRDDCPGAVNMAQQEDSRIGRPAEVMAIVRKAASELTGAEGQPSCSGTATNAITPPRMRSRRCGRANGSRCRRALHQRLDDVEPSMRSLCGRRAACAIDVPALGSRRGPDRPGPGRNRWERHAIASSADEPFCQRAGRDARWRRAQVGNVTTADSWTSAPRRARGQRSRSTFRLLRSERADDGCARGGHGLGGDEMNRTMGPIGRTGPTWGPGLACLSHGLAPPCVAE